MSKFQIDTGEGTYDIKQGIGDVKKGIEKSDLSRVSAYKGKNKGVHTGSKSETVGRHDKPFGGNKK